MNGHYKDAQDFLRIFSMRAKQLEIAKREFEEILPFSDLSLFGRPDIAVGKTIKGSDLGGGYYEQFEKIRIEDIKLSTFGIIRGNAHFDIQYRRFKLNGEPYAKPFNGPITIPVKELEC